MKPTGVTVDGLGGLQSCIVNMPENTMSAPSLTSRFPAPVPFA